MRRGRTFRRRRQRLKQPHAKGTPSLDEEWIALRSWCKAQGVPKSKLALAYFPDTFRGMMATRNIAAGEELIQIPERLLITASKVRQTTLARQGLSNRPQPTVWSLTEHQALVYWIYARCNAHSQPADSWSMYIKSLPSSFPSVPLYVLAGAEPTAELCANTPAKRWVVDHLPPSVRLRVADQLERLHSDWTCTCTQLVKIGLASLADWRRYVWSWLVVNTRCIHLGPQSTASSESMPPKASCLDMLLLPIGKRDSIALAPVLDLLNHSYQASVSTYFDAKCRRFVIKTLRPYHKGDEVFISYGPHDNGFMLAEYGFVLPDNPYCVLSLDHAVESWIRAIKSKLDALRARAPITTENIDTLVALVKQHGLWGDFALSLDTTEPPYRLQATLYLILAAMQGSGLKGAVSRWECWRHGKDINGVGAKAEAATLCWIKQTCTDIALHAQQMSSTIQTTESSSIDPFLVHCLGIIWSKIDAIARHHSRN